MKLINDLRSQILETKQTVTNCLVFQGFLDCKLSIDNSLKIVVTGGYN